MGQRSLSDFYWRKQRVNRENAGKRNEDEPDWDKDLSEITTVRWADANANNRKLDRVSENAMGDATNSNDEEHSWNSAVNMGTDVDMSEALKEKEVPNWDASGRKECGSTRGNGTI